MSDNVNTKRIAKNTMMLYLRMILVMVVSIYMSRVVLKVLGVEDYGTYNVVAGAVAFLGFLNSAMSMATQRFFNVEIGKKEGGDLNSVFNMSMNIHVIIGFVVILLAETIGLWLVNYKLNIPEGRMFAANCAYQCVVVSTFFSMIQVPYNSAIFAYEKMNIFAYLSIFEVSLKLGLTFLLYWIDADKLILYSILMLGVHVLVFFLYSGYVTKKLDGCKLHLMWDKKRFKELSGFMGWNICGQIAQVFTNQGVNMVANVFYGVVLNAAMAITSQVNGAFTMFVYNFQTSFRPQIMKSYAAEQYAEMKSLVYRASKTSFFLLYCISMPILLNINLVLDVWLETVPEYSAIFCKLLIWSSYLEAISMPLVMAIFATGKNKYYQIFVSLFISLNLVLTWVFLKLGFAPEFIFYIKIVVSMLVIGVRLYFANKQAKIEVGEFFKQSIIPIVKVIVVTFPFYYFMSKTIVNCGYLSMVLMTILFLAIIILSISFLGLTSGERAFIIDSIKNKIFKKT